MIALIKTKNIMNYNNLKNKTKRAAVLLLMLAPLAAWAQSRDCNGPIAITATQQNFSPTTTVTYAPAPTSCEPLPVPYTEDFESPQGTGIWEEGPLPDCWDAYTTGNVAASHIVNLPMIHGSQCLFCPVGYLILPEFEVNLNLLQISFWMVNSNTNYKSKLGYITAEDDGTCNTFTLIAEIEVSGIPVQRTIPLLNVPAEAKRLVFDPNVVCFIDDVEVVYGSDCFSVGNLTYGNVSSNSTSLGWALIDNRQTEWDVQVATNANFTENVTNHVASSHENYLVEGLDPDTYYYVRVKPTCSEDLWSNTVQFWTMPPCDGPITVTADAPYTEGFENPEGTNINEPGRLPACWESYTTGTVAPHNTINNVYSGSQSLSFHENGDNYALLPEFSNSIEELQISFWMRCGGGQLQLGYITDEDNGTCNTFTAIENYDYSVTWAQCTTYLLNVPNTAHRLVFKWNGGSCYIDDVEVALVPLGFCYPVSNLSVDSLSFTSAYLNWELIDNSQTAWDVQLATDAAFTNIMADEETDSHENYLLEGLSPGTQYYVRVKPTCNTDLWNTIDFTTLCGPYEITLDAPYIQNFENPEGTATNASGPLPPCWEAYSNSLNPHNSFGWGHGSTQSLAFFNDDFAYALLPEFSNPLNQLQISFWMKTDDNYGTLQLGYLTAEDDGTCNSFTSIVTYYNK